MALEEGSSQQPAANKPSRKGVKNNPVPANWGGKIRVRLNGFQWVELFGSLLTALWVWANFVECDKFAPLCLYAATLLVAHGGVCHPLSKMIGKSAWILWCLLTIATCGVVYNNTPKPIRESAWRAPQLPPNCSNVHLIVGSEVLPEIPVAWLTNGPKEMVKMAITINSNQTNGVTIQAFVKDNGFYVKTPLPVGTTTNTFLISMSDDLDQKLPPNWESNFNRNAYEIAVATPEGYFPLLQVYYRRADDIVVKGVFQSPDGPFMAFGNTPNFIVTPQIPSPLHGRGTMFKYPASLYPGVLAQ